MVGRALQVTVSLLLALGLCAAQQTDFDLRYREGLLALGRNDLRAAQANLEAAGKLQPANPRVLVALAQTYYKLGDRALSQKVALQAEKLGAGDPAVLRSLSIYYADRGEPAKAADFETRHVTQAPQDGPALVRAIRLWLEADRPKEAIRLALRAPGWEGRAEIRNLLGRAYEADQQHTKGVAELQEAIRLNPEEEAYQLDLAFVLLVHHNFDAAIRFLEASRRRFPASAQIELALGVAHYGQGHHERAVQSFLNTISLAPSAEQPYVFLGRILERAGDRFPEIIRQFEALQRREPANHLGYFLHAKALNVRLENQVLSEKLLRKAISLNGSFWESRYELGRVLEQRGLAKEAAGEYRRSARLNPKAPQPHYRLGVVLLQLGQEVAAKAERDLYQKLAAGERAAVQDRIARTTRFDLIIK